MRLQFKIGRHLPEIAGRRLLCQLKRTRQTAQQPAGVLQIGKHADVPVPVVQRQHRLQQYLVDAQCRRRNLAQYSDHSRVRAALEFIGAGEQVPIRRWRVVVPEVDRVPRAFRLVAKRVGRRIGKQALFKLAYERSSNYRLIVSVSQ